MSENPSDVPDTSFVPELDARQRAMLAEMGVRVWSAPTSMPAAEPEAQVQTPVRPQAPAAPVAAPAPVPAAARAAPTPPAERNPVQTPTRPATASASLAALPPGLAEMDWPALGEAVANCQACGLCEGRKQSVFGVGSTQADWMVVGEAPGEHEDQQGEPFVGVSGQLLDNMLRALGLDRQASGASGVYITNAVKCRPPGNRNPLPDELARCQSYLARQIQLVQPKVILAMGRFAVQTLLKTTEPIGRLRGQVHRVEGVPVVVTYHPAYLLRTPVDKAKAWADLCLAAETLQN